MRLSRYTVVSEQNDDGTWVLLHGITGALDVVTSSVVAGLRAFGEFSASQGRTHDGARLPRPADHRPLTPAETILLADRGYLTEATDESEQQLVAVAAAALHDEAARRPSFLALPTLDCNYRCTYCFERPVQNNLRRERASRRPELQVLDIRASHAAANVVMSPPIVDAMYAAIASLRERHGDDRTGGRIVLYGGEPLDAANETVVRYLVDEGRKRSFGFAAITNGHDIETYLDLFGSGGIDQAQISIDGPEQIHDARRISLGPEPSYRRVVRNVNRLLERGETLVQIRVHLDHTNFAYFGTLLDEFESFGWLGHPDLLVYVNTVYKLAPGVPVSADIELHEMDQRLRGLARRYRNLMLNAPSINIRAKWLPALMEGHNIPVQGNYCAANTGQYLFAPDGYMYSCWESVGKADSRIGTFYADGAPALHLEAQKTAEWFGRNAGLIPECRACPMALICGGGCAQFALYATGTQMAPYCDNFDAMFRSGLRDTAEALVQRDTDILRGRPPEGLVAANYM